MTIIAAATGMIHAVCAAPTTSTETPAPASAFMMTAIQEPASRSKVIDCVPDPSDETFQKVCSAGGAVGSVLPVVS